jgi:hypothetical protein
MLAGTRLSSCSSEAYAQAIEIIFGDERPRNLRTDWDHLRAALTSLDVSYADRIQLHRSWSSIKTLSIVKCGQSGNDGENWHWVIYDGKACILYDPLKNEPSRPDKRTRKPRSHLPVG